jgi:hypothetical protein
VPANMFKPQEQIVFKDLVRQYRANPGRRTGLKAQHPDVNWVLLTIHFQASMRNALSTAQTLDVAHLMDAWTDLARELVHIAHKAQEAVGKSIEKTSATHAARLGFLARATWLILTTAAPPPFGALVGAVIRGVCGEESWDKVIDRTYEWAMQAPFPHASNVTDGRVSLAHVITSGEATRSARIQYIGGHPALRELKDFNQVLQKVGMIPNPTISGTIKVWEKKYLPVNLRKLRPPSKATGHLMANQVHLECRDKAKALVSAVESALAEYSDDRDNAESVLCAAYNWVFEYNKPNPRVEFVINMFDPSHPLAPSRLAPASKRDKKNEIVNALDAFRNTFAADLVHELRHTLRAQPVGIINRDDAQSDFERVFIAHYLKAVTEAPPASGVAASVQGDREHWANVVGTVPSNVVSSHLEVKMQTLGIIKKLPLISKGVAPGEIYEMACRVWIPPDTTNFMPVPFKTGELSTRGARGRLAAWAHDYIERVAVDDVFKSIYKALRSAAP